MDRRSGFIGLAVAAGIAFSAAAAPPPDPALDVSKLVSVEDSLDLEAQKILSDPEVIKAREQGEQDLLAAMNLADAADAAPPGADAGPADGAPAGAGPAVRAAPVRSRVLSAIGRDATAGRWYASEHGPRSPLAHAAPAPCATCGFLVSLGSPLGRVFGVCANEYAPDDGKVVSLDHGCGAHSEAMTPAGPFSALAPVVDELGYDLVEAPGVPMAETVFESLDRG